MLDREQLKQLQRNYTHCLGLGLNAEHFVRDLRYGNYWMDDKIKKLLRMIKHTRKAYGVNTYCIALAVVNGVEIFAFDYKKDGKRIARYTTVDDNKTVEFELVY